MQRILARLKFSRMNLGGNIMNIGVNGQQI